MKLQMLGVQFVLVHSPSGRTYLPSLETSELGHMVPCENLITDWERPEVLCMKYSKELRKINTFFLFLPLCLQDNNQKAKYNNCFKKETQF